MTTEKMFGYTQLSEHDKKIIDRKLIKLSDRLALIEREYNQDRLNLHFEPIIKVDATIFEALYAIGVEGWQFVRKYPWPKSFYWRDQRGFFYRLFLILSNASMRVYHEKQQGHISLEIVERWVKLSMNILAAIGPLHGDITKRNLEALEGLILAFDSTGSLEALAVKLAKKTGQDHVIQLTRISIEDIKKYHQEQQNIREKEVEDR